MSIEDILASPDQRSPYLCFIFEQDGAFFRYTTASETKIVDGVSYVVKEIAIDKVARSVSEGTSDASITLPFDDPVVAIFDAFLPVQPVTVTVYSLEENDVTVSKRVVLSGQVTTVNDQADGTTKLSIKAVYAALNRSIPWQFQQRTCPLATYGVQCGVNRELFKTTAVGLTAIDGESVSGSAFEDKMVSTGQRDWFQAGYLFCRRTREIRFVISQGSVGSGQLFIAYPFDQANAADTFDAYAGDQRTGTVCQHKFNNRRRFMGFEKIPTKNFQKTGIQ